MPRPLWSMPGPRRVPLQSLEMIQALGVFADDFLLGVGREFCTRGFDFIDNTGKGAVKVRIVRPPNDALLKPRLGNTAQRTLCLLYTSPSPRDS